MANVKIDGIGIKGIASAVPSETSNNSEYKRFSEEEFKKFYKTTGIKQRRISNRAICTSDLCLHAAEKLLRKLNWSPNDIDILIFASQTPDFLIPSTSNILQERLGISNNAIVFDINLGCSGYVYSLYIATGLLKSSLLKKALVLVGDTISKYCSIDDKSSYPLFGDAGTATALEYSDDENDVIFFDLGTDGSGSNVIKIQSGGCRNPASHESFIPKELEKGVSRNELQLYLNGPEIFTFSLREAPLSVNKVLAYAKYDKDNVDYFVFHQANMLMNTMIAKKIKIQYEKVLYSLENYGNTSSASIPLTISANNNHYSNKKIVLCGFGVGLSWGSMFFNSKNLEVLDVIEYE